MFDFYDDGKFGGIVFFVLRVRLVDFLRLVELLVMGY